MPPHHRRYYCLIGAIALCVLFPKGILSNSLVARDNTLICDLFHNIYIHITYGINAMFGCGGNDSGRCAQNGSFQIPLLLLGGWCHHFYNISLHITFMTYVPCLVLVTMPVVAVLKVFSSQNRNFQIPLLLLGGLCHQCQWGRCIFKMAAACTDKLGSTILEFEFLKIK